MGSRCDVAGFVLFPKPGQETAVAFAVWDGAQRDRNGQKAVSVWQRLVIEAGK